MGYTKIKDVLRLEPQATAPLSPSEGDIYNDAVDGILVYKQGDWQALGSGGSADFDNLVTIDGDGLPTLSDNTDFETSAGAWYVYADAAAVTPVDMASGSPVSTRARTTSGPLSGEASLLFDLGTGSSRQGEGLALEIVVPVGVRGGPVNFSMLVSVTGAVSNDDLRFFAYDVTNTELVYPTYGTQILGSGLVQCVFPTKTTTAALRVGIHVARTATTALSLKLDDVKATRRQGNVLGLAGSDTLAVTMLPSAGFGSVTSPNYWQQRVGDTATFAGRFTAPSSGGTTAFIGLPAGLTINLNKISTAASGMIVGQWRRVRVPTSGTDSFVPLFFDGSDVNNIYLSEGSSGSGVLTKFPVSSLISAGDIVEFNLFPIPIAGWSANVTMASDPAAIPTAFSAGMAANYIVAANQPILWDTVVADTVGAYNIATGIYTVRVAGNYKISATIRPTATAASYVQINATAHAYLSESGPSILTSGSAEYYLAVGDQVSIRLTAGTTVTGNPVQFYGTFTMARITGSTSIALESIRSELSFNARAGYGSTATKVPYFTNAVATNQGADLSYVNNSTNGLAVTVLRDGVYAATYQDLFGISDNMGVSVNGSVTTVVSGLAAANRPGYCATNVSGESAIVTVILVVRAGDVIRPHTDSANGTTQASAIFRITRVS